MSPGKRSELGPSADDAAVTDGTRHGYDPRLEVHGAGPLLVYVPGIDGTGRLFYRQVPRFEAAGFAVVTYRLRDDAAHWATLVEDLWHVIAEARQTAHAPPGDLTLVAESFGGALALHFALQHPTAVTRLVILNSFAHFERQLRVALAVAGLHLIGWRTLAVIRRLIARGLHSRSTPRGEIRRFLRRTDETTVSGYARRLSLLRVHDVRDRLSELRIPTLFLASEQDRVLPSVREARRMHREVPGSSVRVLRGHGHVCLVAPDLDLAEILLDWAPEAAP